MSKKNSSVNRKKDLKYSKAINKIYLSFKKKLDKLKKKSFLVAVSGGPDSLALVTLSKIYSIEKKVRFYYVLVNHNIRKNSLKEAREVQYLLKKNKLHLVILNNKKKINKNIQSNASYKFTNTLDLDNHLFSLCCCILILMTMAIITIVKFYAANYNHTNEKIEAIAETEKASDSGVP